MILSPALRWFLRFAGLVLGLIFAVVLYTRTMMPVEVDITDRLKLEIKFPPPEYRNQNPFMTLTNKSGLPLVEGLVICAGFDDQNAVAEVYKLQFKAIRPGRRQEQRAVFRDGAAAIRRLECRIHTAVTPIS